MSFKLDKQKFFILFFIIALAVAFFGQRYYYKDINIKIAEKNVNVLVAKSIWQQKKGLGNRDKLQKNDGMLLNFSVLSRHGIVMRDMNFSIDIFWLKDGEIVDMAFHVDPEPGVEEKDLRVYYPRVVSNLVLEFPTGIIDRDKIKIGDKIEIVE